MIKWDVDDSKGGEWEERKSVNRSEQEYWAEDPTPVPL